MCTMDDGEVEAGVLAVSFFFFFFKMQVLEQNRHKNK